MPPSNDESIPYRAPVTAPTTNDAADRDEEEFSTLEDVKKTLDQALEALYKDFNAFDILKLLGSPKLDDAARKLLVQIEAKQVAFDILMPLQSTIDSAIQNVVQKRKGN